ncbi:MAG: hypothetical protein FD180_4152 [Planctomycetota bacterium]|nr:MAG: hypothetical protein FD180_4152 [Planctomycetota bacterium]
MPELSSRGHAIRLGYSMNVHPCETADELDAALRDGPGEIRRRLFAGRKTGAGLRLSAQAADLLAGDPYRLAKTKALLESLDLFAFTANVFPFGKFNAGRVKEDVYRPSWADPRRAAYTLAAAHVMAALGGGQSLTLSTVAGGYKADGDDKPARDNMARNLAQVAAGLHTLKNETGVSIRVCLEPEPLTTCETAADAIEFFRRHIYPGGERALHGTDKYNREQATDILHEHLGLCFDACHHAVMWEDPAEAIDRIDRSGIVIGKMQVTCALEGPPGELARFDEPRYFHQVCAEGGRRAADLGEAKGWPDGAARAHFHVPVFLEQIGGLKTTQGFLKAAMEEVLKRGLCSDFEIETYTWDVIPAAEREKTCGKSLVESLMKEYDWVMKVLEAR